LRCHPGARDRPHTLAAMPRLLVETIDPSSWADLLRISPWQLGHGRNQAQFGRSLRREATCRNHSLVYRPARINSLVPSAVGTSKVVRNRAKKRDQASIFRVSKALFVAEPVAVFSGHRLSGQVQIADQVLGLYFPFLFCTRLIEIQNRRGNHSQYSSRLKFCRRELPTSPRTADL